MNNDYYENEDIDLNDISSKIVQDLMTQNLKKYGNDYCWNVIESLGRCKDRIKYRILFLTVGGLCPESDIMKQNEV